jgi:regulator of replication initiation timing
MENKVIVETKNKSLKAVIVLLALLLLGSIGYMYKVMTESKAIESVLISEKESVQKDLAVIKDSLNAAIASNTAMSEDLMIERDKVVKLMDEIENTKSDLASIQKMKSQFSKLKQEVAFLVKENNSLKKQNRKLRVERDSTSMALTKVKSSIDTLSNYNRNLARAVEKGSKLAFINLKAQAFKLRSSGKNDATDKASRADILKVSFTIAENQIAKAGNKSYYVQVLDSNNNVIGEKKVENFENNKSLTYSYMATVTYENQLIETSNDIKVKDLKGGTYFINIFDRNEILAKTSFDLK